MVTRTAQAADSAVRAGCTRISSLRRMRPSRQIHNVGKPSVR
ncbi:hypothetical protein V3C99_014553, partial [Haemonchus contortus]